MRKNPQWRIEIKINAPLKKVWDIGDDLTLIPQFHPEVRTVEFISGQTRRAVGVSYKCIVPEGRKGWCIERIVEHVPYQRTLIDFPEDSWELSRMFSDFMTELGVSAADDGSTIVFLEAYYSPNGFIVSMLNALLMRRVMRKKAMLTLQGLKRLVES
ncbi:MAG: SRPBCC family protein, partial [Candidatus Zixiibacteriota bacterium]